MADMTKFYTRVQLKYDTWANWSVASTDAKPWVPLKGEVCLVEVPTGSSSGLQDTPPSVLMKVGDGTTAFHKLPWLSALAADVHSWAKLDATKFVNWLNGETVEGMATCPVTFATDTELATVNSALTALGARVSTAEGKITTLEGEMDTAQNDISDIKEALGLGGAEDSGVTARVKALEDSVGTPVTNANGKADGTAYERIAKNADDISTINSKLNIINGADTVDGSIAKALKDAKDYSDSKDTEQTTTLQGYADGKASAAETAAKDYADGLDTEVRKAFAAADSAIDAKIATLVGSVAEDDTKSAREIAAEEVAKVVDGAPEALDTLKEIATWIGNDTMGAASIVANLSDVINEVYGVSDGIIPEGDSRIDTNEKAITTEKARAEGAEKALSDRIDDLAGTGSGSIADQISSAIGAARAEWEQDIADANTLQDTILQKYADDAVGVEKSARESAVAEVQEQIDTLNGADTVTGSVAKAVKDAKREAASDATTKADQALADAKTYADGLKETIDSNHSSITNALDARLDIIEGTGEGSIKKAVADEKARAEGAESALAGRATALEQAVGASSDAANASGTLYARVAQNKADIASEVSRVNGIAARPFVAVESNGPASYTSTDAFEQAVANGTANGNDFDYVVFYCGTSSIMI